MSFLFGVIESAYRFKSCLTFTEQSCKLFRHSSQTSSLKSTFNSSAPATDSRWGPKIIISVDEFIWWAQVREELQESCCFTLKYLMRLDGEEHSWTVHIATTRVWSIVAPLCLSYEIQWRFRCCRNGRWPWSSGRQQLKSPPLPQNNLPPCRHTAVTSEQLTFPPFVLEHWSVFAEQCDGWPSTYQPFVSHFVVTVI